MRIVILCLSPSRGGLELYALDEMKQLTVLGHDCIMVVAKGGYLDSVLTKDNIQHETLNVSFKGLPLVAATKLAKILSNFTADILHFHWVKDLNLAALCKSLTTQAVKLVHTRHMNITRSKKDIFHRWFYQKINLLLVGTKALRNQSYQFLPLSDKNIKLLYLGTASPSENNIECNTIFSDDSFAKRTLNLAVFGRIEEGKGQHLVIAAVKTMLQQDKDVSLTLIGHTMDKVYQADLERNVKKMKLGKYIRFKGFLDNATDYMPCFDVVVLSTHCETFGLVLIEAMRAGVAVVGTNAGGVPEIIEDGVSGYLVKPRNVDDMQRIIDNIYSKPKKRKIMAAEGKQRADSLFSNDVHYPKLETLLQSILK